MMTPAQKRMAAATIHRGTITDSRSAANAAIRLSASERDWLDTREAKDLAFLMRTNRNSSFS